MNRYWEHVIKPIVKQEQVKRFVVLNGDGEIFEQLYSYVVENKGFLYLLGMTDFLTSAFLKENENYISCQSMAGIIEDLDAGALIVCENKICPAYDISEVLNRIRNVRIIVNQEKRYEQELSDAYPEYTVTEAVFYGGMQFITAGQQVEALQTLLCAGEWLEKMEQVRVRLEQDFRTYEIQAEAARRKIYEDEEKKRTEEVRKTKKEYKSKINAIKNSKRYKIGSRLADMMLLSKKKEDNPEPESNAGGKRLDQLAEHYEITQAEELFDVYYRYSMLLGPLQTPWSEREEQVIQVMEERKQRLLKAGTKQSEKMVSVILPVFSMDKNLENALQSLAGQSHENWECIVLDASKEDAVKVQLKTYMQDSRIHYIKCEGTKNSSVVRNIGLAAAKGKYISYLDARYVWDEAYLQTAVAKLEEDASIRSVYCGKRVLFEKEGEIHTDSVQLGVFAIAHLENHNYLDIHSFMHERTLYLEYGGFDETLSQTADWELLLRYGRHVYPYALPVILVDERKEGQHEWQEDAMEISRFVSTFNQNKMHMEEILPVIENGYGLYANLEIKRYPAGKRKVAIIIPNYEALHCLRLCVAAVRKYSRQFDYEIIIVDNCSSEVTQSYLKCIQNDSDITVIQNDYNMGFTYAVNQGIKTAREGSDYILLNNDAIVTENWLEELYQVKERIPEAGLIVPRQELVPYTRTMNLHVPCCKESREIDVNLSFHHKNILNVTDYASYGYIQISFAAFFVVMITKDCYEKLGLLDEVNGRHYKSDRLYCEQAQKEQIKMIYTPESKVYHMLQQSTQQLRKQDKEMFDIILKKNNWDDLKDKNIELNRNED